MHAALGGAWISGCVLGLLFAPACVGDLVAENGHVRHRQHGYRVAAPGSVWRQTSVDGAALVYRGPEASLMSLISRCDRPLASPQVMSRQLTIGLRRIALYHAAPIAVRGVNGWIQSLDVARGDETVRLKTVTLVGGRCSFDFVLVAARNVAERERAPEQHIV